MASKSVPKFSDSIIKKLEPNNTLTCNSLQIRCWNSGSKTWSFNYRFGEDRRVLSIGQYPYVSIADANAGVLEARRLIALGVDPAKHKKESDEAAKREQVEVITVQDLYDLWMEKKVRASLAERTIKDYEKEVPKHILSVWGDLPIKSITRKMGINLLQSMADKGNIAEGKRVRAYLSGMWQYALDHEIVESHPFSRLPEIYAPADIKLKKEKTKRDTTRYLNDKEIYQFWHGSIKFCEPITGAALRLMLLLGRRGVDVRPMLKSEIDLERKIWHMTPGKVRENKKEKYVPVIMPLPPLALDIIKTLMSKGGTTVDLMFPSNDIDCLGLPITQSALSQPVTRHKRFGIVRPWTPHDLRRTASTGMSLLGIDQPIINKVLAHKLGTLEGIYNQNSFIKERQIALTKWNNHIQKIISGPDPFSK